MLFERVFKFGECLGFVFLAMNYRTLYLRGVLKEFLGGDVRLGPLNP